MGLSFGLTRNVDRSLYAPCPTRPTMRAKTFYGEYHRVLGRAPKAVPPRRENKYEPNIAYSPHMALHLPKDS